MEAEVADEAVQRGPGEFPIDHRQGGMRLAGGRPSVEKGANPCGNGQGDVLSNGQVGMKREFLVNDGDLAAAVRLGKDVAGGVAKDEFANECRLAGAVAAEERVNFAALYRKIHAFKDGRCAIGLGQ